MAGSLPLPFEQCDACPAPATVTVRLPAGGDVVLCGSHARRHAPALLEQGAAIEGDYGWQCAPEAGAFVENARPLPYSEPEWQNPRAEMSWLARVVDRFLKPHEVRGYPRPT
jgi:hypothetical protein